jgi:hypothetical protein
VGEIVQPWDQTWQVITTSPPWQWHFTTWLALLDHWQTLVAGVLALAAAFGTIVVTSRLANRQIAASRDEADRVIAATRAQTKATFKQTETTVDLEQMRDASEASAFHVMLEAAMARVLAEAAWARKAYPDILTQETGASVEALVVRQCITNGAFAELRAACVRQGGPLTGEFLGLEREIDSFASQSELGMSPVLQGAIRKGRHYGLGEQLALIETKARELRQKAAERI